LKDPYIERLPQVLARVGIGRSTLYSMIQRGAFPAPLKLGTRAVGWLSTDVNAFIQTRDRAMRPREDV
jgi:prophage regulatory protein